MREWRARLARNYHYNDKWYCSIKTDWAVQEDLTSSSRQQCGQCAQTAMRMAVVHLQANISNTNWERSLTCPHCDMNVDEDEVHAMMVWPQASTPGYEERSQQGERR